MLIMKNSQIMFDFSVRDFLPNSFLIKNQGNYLQRESKWFWKNSEVKVIYDTSFVVTVVTILWIKTAIQHASMDMHASEGTIMEIRS